MLVSVLKAVNFTPSETSNSQTLENGSTSVLVEPSATNMPPDSQPHGIPPEIPASPVICSTTATAPQQSITSSTLPIGNPPNSRTSLPTVSTTPHQQGPSSALPIGGHPNTPPIPTTGSTMIIAPHPPGSVTPSQPFYHIICL